MMWFTTTLAAGCLGLIHPALSLLLGYEYFLLLAATRVMNQTTNLIVLDKNKRSVLLNKLNFLGYEKKLSPKCIDLANITYIGEYENTSVTLDNFGLLPSVSKYLGREGEKNNFRYFYKFMADNEIYLVAKDHENHETFCPSESLLEAIMKGKQKSVFDHDFTEEEAEMEKLVRERDETIKEIMNFKNETHHDERQHL